jgi:hypothetical protein
MESPTELILEKLDVNNVVENRSPKSHFSSVIHLQIVRLLGLHQITRGRHGVFAFDGERRKKSLSLSVFFVVYLFDVGMYVIYRV